MNFARFERALREAWGEEAARARHEIYFIAQRGRGWRQATRAFGGLLRDAWRCTRLPRDGDAPSGVVCVASLAGASGWDVLAPLLPSIAAGGHATSAVLHPRLRGRVAGVLPAAPDARAWRAAWQALRTRSGKALPGVSPWTVRCCLARQRLWCGAWQRTLARANGAVRALLLHNDFDLFSAAAVQAARCAVPQRIRTVCVQHGLPTDEFFPARADIQLVWGESSRRVFVERGTPGGSVVAGTHRAPALARAAAHPAPSRILLVSQTHTPVFGRALAQEFRHLAEALAAASGGRFEILLHPEEARLGHPYAAGRLAPLCRKPPHPALHPGGSKQPELVAGFCSTALIEAARAGHYVLGLDWEVPASLGALAVGAPPHKARDAAEVLQRFRELREDAAAREAWMAAQQAWLARSLAALPENWFNDLIQAEAAAVAGDTDGACHGPTTPSAT